MRNSTFQLQSQRFSGPLVAPQRGYVATKCNSFNESPRPLAQHSLWNSACYLMHGHSASQKKEKTNMAAKKSTKSKKLQNKAMSKVRPLNKFREK